MKHLEFNGHMVYWCSSIKVSHQMRAFTGRERGMTLLASIVDILLSHILFCDHSSRRLALGEALTSPLLELFGKKRGRGPGVEHIKQHS